MSTPRPEHDCATSAALLAEATDMLDHMASHLEDLRDSASMLARMLARMIELQAETDALPIHVELQQPHHRRRYHLASQHVCHHAEDLPCVDVVELHAGGPDECFACQHDLLRGAARSAPLLPPPPPGFGREDRN